MFLVTTADLKFWKKDEKILFLGEWCKKYSEKNIWSKLDHAVLPHDWNDRKKMYQDYLYIDRVYERYLSVLSQKLNTLHFTNHSFRYWRIIIGPWLNLFIGIIYDKYLSIQSAKNSGLVTNTWLSPFNSTDFLTKDFHDFRKQSFMDNWNHCIYCQLIKTIGGFTYETKEVQTLPTPLDEIVFSHPSGQIKNLTRSLLRKISRLVPDKFNQIFITSGVFGAQNLIRLQLSLKQIPYLFSPHIEIEDNAVCDLARNELKCVLGGNQFESLLDEFIPQNMPKVYVEGYSKIYSRSNEVFPKRPKLIISGSSIYTDEGFRFWAAYQVEQGTKLYCHQYGGGYGCLRWHTMENHEIKISDHYLSWGWKLNNQPKVIPTASGKLVHIKNKINHNPKGGILWVGLSYPRYSALWMVTISRMQDYLKEQERFVVAISPEVRRLLSMRCYPVEYGWSENKRLTDIYPSLKVYRGEKPFFRELNQNRLCIATYNSTTFLETFAANYPTILFCDPDQYELRPSAQPYFDNLSRVGIFHDSPESAAAKVNEIYQDTMGWWMSPKIQTARSKFCHQFARTSDSWLAEWKKGMDNFTSPKIHVNK